MHTSSPKVGKPGLRSRGPISSEGSRPQSTGNSEKSQDNVEAPPPAELIEKGIFGNFF